MVLLNLELDSQNRNLKKLELDSQNRNLKKFDRQRRNIRAEIREPREQGRKGLGILSPGHSTHNPKTVVVVAKPRIPTEARGGATIPRRVDRGAAAQ
jgi:hypothetical protein